MMRDMDGRALPPPSIAFSGRRSDKSEFVVKAGAIERAWSFYQSLVEEINRFYRGVRKQRGEWSPLADGQRSDVIARAAGGDAVELLQTRRADDVEDEIQLVAVVASREQRTSGQHFGEDAAHCPDIDGLMKYAGTYVVHEWDQNKVAISQPWRSHLCVHLE